MQTRKLIAGNWKMNGSRETLAELEAIEAAVHDGVDVAMCVPATLIAPAAERARKVVIGAQDVHHRDCGAHTGCVSAAMLVEAGAKMVIVGHSERRTDQRESDGEVRDKAQSAIAAGLQPIICVGETLQERDAGEAERVVRRQLDGSLPDAIERCIVAYEPVWAIGTGRTPSVEDVAAMHQTIRDKVGPTVRILYGGSVKPSNARELLAVANVDGALVGGASLAAADFVPIIQAA